MLQGVDAAPEEKQSLMLALATLGHEKSDEIRAATYEAAILSALADGKTRMMSEVVRNISQQLHLGRELPEHHIASAVDKLHSKGSLDRDQRAVQITPTGLHAYEQMIAIAESSRKQGRDLIREQLETSLGRRLPDTQFDEMWSDASKRPELVDCETRRCPSFAERRDGNVGDAAAELEAVCNCFCRGEDPQLDSMFYMGFDSRAERFVGEPHGLDGRCVDRRSTSFSGRSQSRPREASQWSGYETRAPSAGRRHRWGHGSRR